MSDYIENNVEQPPIKLIEELSLYNLVKAGRKYLAVSKSLGPTDLLKEKLGEREIAPLILVGENFEEFKERVLTLEISLKQPSVDLIEETHMYNLFRAGERYIAVSKSLGAVNLLGHLGERDIDHAILVEDKLNALKEKVLFTENSLKQPLVDLIEETSMYNLFAVGDRYIGVSKSLGAINLLGYMTERDIGEHILVGDTPEDVKKKILTIEASLNQKVKLIEEFLMYNLLKVGDRYIAILKTFGPPDLLEQLENSNIDTITFLSEKLEELWEQTEEMEATMGRPLLEKLEETSLYNLFRTGEHYIALAKSLGKVDLMEEKLGEREIKPVILEGKDIESLHVKILNIEKDLNLFRRLKTLCHPVIVLKRICSRLVNR